MLIEIQVSIVIHEFLEKYVSNKTKLGFWACNFGKDMKQTCFYLVANADFEQSIFEKA